MIPLSWELSHLMQNQESMSFRFSMGGIVPEQNATFDKSMLQMTMPDVGDAFSNDHHFWFVKFRSVPSLKLGHPSGAILLGPGLLIACCCRECRYHA